MNPTVREITNWMLDRLSTLLMLFGITLVLVGGVVQGVRMWRVAQAERALPAPAFEESLGLPAPPTGNVRAGSGGNGEATAPSSNEVAPALAAVDDRVEADAQVAADEGTQGPPGPTLEPKEATVVAVLDRISATRSVEVATATAHAIGAMPAALGADPGPREPERIVIPAIDLDVPVEEIGWEQELVDNDTLRSVWETAADAAGFHRGSAPLGAVGNTVISGHNNIDGAVFRRLHELASGDRVFIFSGDRPAREYEIWTNFVVRDAGVPYEQRVENAKWIGDSPDERLTLVTCYPPWGNTHRTIVVARPVGDVVVSPEEALDAE